MSGKRVLNILTGDYVINSPAGRLDRPWNGALSQGNTDSTGDYGAPGKKVILRLFNPFPVNDPLAPGALRKNGERMPNFDGTYLFRNDFPVMNEPGKGEQLEESDDLFVSESCKGSF
jgi:galactose-1-phosphate uridylyltransferase